MVLGLQALVGRLGVGGSLCGLLSPHAGLAWHVLPLALGLVPAADDGASALWHVLAGSAQPSSLYVIEEY